jgi:hypothetical protein
MMSQLTWSALILAALAAVAYSNPEGQPACIESRPVFGVRACCERHKVAGLGAFRTVSDLESVRRAEGLLDRRAEDATQVTPDRLVPDVGPSGDRGGDRCSRASR